MAKISTNIEKEEFNIIISKLKKEELTFYDMLEKDNHKFCYFNLNDYVYFIHSFKGSIDVLNKISPVKETTSTAQLEEKPSYKTVTIYSDGACQPNPGESGSGISVYHADVFETCYYGLYLKDSTNNIAELKALYAALQIANEYKIKGIDNIVIKTDSRYSIDCLTTWIEGWIKRKWLNTKRQPIKNRDIIEPMYNLYLTLKDNVLIQHVYAHSGIEGNEIADRMSVLAIDNKTSNLIEYKVVDVNQILKLRSGIN